MTHTTVLISYTVECAFLFVTWTTLPLSVTATRRVPSGDHATSHTLRAGQKQKKAKWTRTPPSNCAVHTIVCVAILVMRIDLSSLPVATKVPSGEIAQRALCKYKEASAQQHTTTATYPFPVRFPRRLFHQHLSDIRRLPFLRLHASPPSPLLQSPCFGGNERSQTANLLRIAASNQNESKQNQKLTVCHFPPLRRHLAATARHRPSRCQLHRKTSVVTGSM